MITNNIKLLYIDLFCGAGGTTTGVELATLHGEKCAKVSELLAIQGFPADYKLVGTQSEQKKFIGNAVEVNQSRALCEALAERVAV